MSAIVTAMVAFTTIVVTLAALVLSARRWLEPTGTSSLRLNERTELVVRNGEKLLWALAANGIQLPAACGGRGSCGQCRVQIRTGRAPPLPTESVQISAPDLRRGLRLACMTVVRDDMAIQVSDEILEAKRYACRVRSNGNVATFLTELVLEVEDESFLFEPGDYVLLEAPAGSTRFSDFEIDAQYRGDWRRLGLLEMESTRPEPAVRAYSLANHPGEHGIATLVVRIATPPAGAPDGTPPGLVSSYVFGLKPGDPVHISGPFGDFHCLGGEREMVFIGGGAGIAPMRSMILDQLLGKNTRRRISFWYGARSRREICYQDTFDELAERFDNFTWQVALSEPKPEDAWDGPVGFIHSVVYDRYLAAHPAPEEAEYYMCGPPLMSSAVLAMLEDLGVDRESVMFDDFGS